MSPEGILFAALLSGLTIFIGMWSFLTSSKTTQRTPFEPAENNSQQDVPALRLQLNVLIDSVRDLDFDYDTGKVADDVYAEQRKMLLGRATGVLHRLDQREMMEDSRNLQAEAAIMAYRRSQTHS